MPKEILRVEGTVALYVFRIVQIAWLTFNTWRGGYDYNYNKHYSKHCTLMHTPGRGKGISY